MEKFTFVGLAVDIVEHIAGAGSSDRDLFVGNTVVVVVDIAVGIVVDMKDKHVLVAVHSH